jgi:hypothetical protein
VTIMGRMALLLIGVVAGCTTRPPSTGPSPAPYGEPGAASAEPPVITLERTPCFGTCPVYQVAISRSGTVRFVGKQHVTRQGEATAEIPAARVDSLLRELEAGGYFGFADAYLMDAPACGRYATDSPTVITSANAGGRTKTIRHDYGCDAAPQELGRLERLIDEVAGSSSWVGH